MNPSKLVILGFGGHARSVADIALSMGFRELLFVDSNAAPGEDFVGHRVTKSIDIDLADGWAVFPAAGRNDLRQIQCDQIHALGMSPVVLVSPLASIGAGAHISEGSVVGHHAHVGPMARIGIACIINTGAVVEHECLIGAYSHVSVNGTVAGRSSLGSHSMLGAGGVIIDGVSVCDRVIVGAGAVVHRSIEEAGTYAGVPAVRLR
jgi:UDP-N-acetylbacillosamine N-acetyltransferase